jgi:prevent-host-death family protein
MATVNTTEFRQNLPSYLRRAAAGEEIRITSRGRVIARLLPEEDRVAAARQRLDALQGQVRLGDVESPSGEEWNAEQSLL